MMVPPQVFQNAVRAPNTTVARPLMTFHTVVSRFLIPVQILTKLVLICSPCFAQKLVSPFHMAIAVVLMIRQTAVRTALTPPKRRAKRF